MSYLPPSNNFNEDFDPLRKLVELLGAASRHFYIPEHEVNPPSEDSDVDNSDDGVLDYRIPETQGELVDEYFRQKLAAVMMTRMIIPIGIATTVSAVTGNVIFLSLTLAFCLQVLRMILRRH